MGVCERRAGVGDAVKRLKEVALGVFGKSVAEEEEVEREGREGNFGVLTGIKIDGDLGRASSSISNRGFPMIVRSEEEEKREESDSVDLLGDLLGDLL